MRDRIAWWLANAALRMASQRYRNYVTEVFLLGVDEFARRFRKAALDSSDEESA